MTNDMNTPAPEQAPNLDPAADNLPKDLLHPGGLAEEIMDYVNETAICRQPMFALSAALTVCGLLFGRRWQDESGQRTNLFFINVGYTSAGKDHALKSAKRILDAAGANRLWISQVTSDSALEHGLSRQPRLLMIIDEAGHFFSSVNDPGGSAAARSIKPILLEAWSSANCVWKGKQRAPQRDKPEIPVEIKCPHVCLLGTTQPMLFFDGVSRVDIADGWLARPVFFISRTRPPARLDLPPKPIPDGIVAKVRALRDEPVLEDDVRTVPADDEAKAILRDFNDRVRQFMLQSDTDRNERSSLYGKAVENARRIALTLAISRNQDRPTITAAEMTFGVALMSYTIRYAISAVDENLAENEHERAKKRILKVVRETGPAGVLRKDLTRKTQYLKRQLRDECLDDLIEAGEIVRERTTSGADRFRLGRA